MQKTSCAISVMAQVMQRGTKAEEYITNEHKPGLFNITYYTIY